MVSDVDFVANAVTLVKQREGILNKVQDDYIKAIVEGVIGELENQHGIRVDMSAMDMFMFVVDMASYRYSNRDSLEPMSKHLEYRLKTFYMQSRNDME